MADNPEGFLARRIGANQQDLARVKDMFTTTHHWRRNFFRSLSNSDKFSLPNFFSANNFIVKSTRTDSYEGEGVFEAGNRGKKDYQQLYDNLRLEIGRVIVSTKDENLLSKLVDEIFLADFKTYLKNQDRFEKLDKKNFINPTLLNILSVANAAIDYDKFINQLGLDHSSLAKICNIRERIQDGKFNSIAEFDHFINNYTYLLAVGTKIELSDENLDLLRNNIISYFSTRLILPYVIQEKVIRESSDELRLSGFVADHSSNNVTLLSKIKVSESQTPAITLFPIIPSRLPERSVDRTQLEESKILEVEATAPSESTALELSILPKNKRYKKTLVLMCGAGRHAQYLAASSEQIIGVDISPKFIEEAIRLNTNKYNILYEVDDARHYVKRTELKGSFNLTVLLGLGLGYLVPQEQLDLLQDVYSSLMYKGTIVFDFVDLSKFGEILNLQGPVGMRFIQNDQRILQRLTRREIVTDTQDFSAINDNTSYIVDNVSEILNEKSVYYVPTPEGTRKRMKGIGYKNIKIQPIFDDRYVGMLQHRWIVTAQK